MRMILKRVLTLCALLCAAPQVFAADNNSCTLRMAAETDFPPHLIKQQEQWSGLSVELM
uniref:Uncharacterized protein n=1 Tax=Rheinheimera sp. BAL341 TaxID=1708203 RepID=A0A486XI06_9GAMM